VSATILSWAERIAQIGHGRRSEIRAQTALERARAAEPDLTPLEDPADPVARRPGDTVRIAAEDYGVDPIEGTLVRLRPDSVAIVREDPVAGRIVNHFPRIGFRVLAASPPEPSEPAAA
jgi:hypothetical protein